MQYLFLAVTSGRLPSHQTIPDFLGIDPASSLYVAENPDGFPVQVLYLQGRNMTPIGLLEENPRAQAVLRHAFGRNVRAQLQRRIMSQEITSASVHSCARQAVVLIGKWRISVRDT